MPDGIDYNTGQVSVTLHEGIVDASDYSWPAVQGATLDTLVVYGDYRVRDWRWLWLRHRIVTRLINYVEL